MLELSVAILAGGKSSRMGVDKAFLKINGVPFIKIIYDKASALSDDVMVIIGNKKSEEFRRYLPSQATILNDLFYTMSPVGGLITAAFKSKYQYFVALAVDMPLINPKVVERLYFRAKGRSAAVPVLKDGTAETLCAVYNTSEVKKINPYSISSLRELVNLLPNPVFVSAEAFIDVDPNLDSFFNVNTKGDLEILFKKFGNNVSSG